MMVKCVHNRRDHRGLIDVSEDVLALCFCARARLAYPRVRTRLGAV